MSHLIKYFFLSVTYTFMAKDRFLLFNSDLKIFIGRQKSGKNSLADTENLYGDNYSSQFTVNHSLNSSLELNGSYVCLYCNNNSTTCYLNEFFLAFLFSHSQKLNKSSSNHSLHD